MTPSNGNIFRITGPLCRELTCHRWIPAQRLVTQSFDVFFDLRLNKRLSKQWWGWWFETSSCLLWRHCNGRATVVAIPHNGLDSCVLLLCISVWCTQRNIRGDERNRVTYPDTTNKTLNPYAEYIHEIQQIFVCMHRFIKLWYVTICVLHVYLCINGMNNVLSQKILCFISRINFSSLYSY